MVAAAAIIATSLRVASAMLPQVGDTISFDPSSGGPLRTQATLQVQRLGTAANARCTLDLRVMQANGGSLIVEAIQPGPVLHYRVHWAGGRTSDSTANCGASANLLVTPYDMGALLFTASRRL